MEPPLHFRASAGPSVASSAFDDSAQLEDSPGKRGCRAAWPPGSAAGSSAAWTALTASEDDKLTATGSDGDWREREFYVPASVAGGGLLEGFLDPEEDGSGYGADELLPLTHRPEMLAVAWMVLLLAAAAGVNLYTALAAPGRQRAQAVETPRAQPRMHRGPPPPPAPPSPPGHCSAAPALQSERYSGLSVTFPTEAAHYQDNTALKEAGVGANQVAVVGGSSALAGGVGGLSGSGSASTAGASEAVARTPLYYNGRVPAYCLVTVEATYTCWEYDKPCIWSVHEGRSRCQAACANTAACYAAANLRAHPLRERVCGLLAAARPACTAMESTAAGLRQLRAYYRLNLCMAPPQPPQPQPPAPPP